MSSRSIGPDDAGPWVKILDLVEDYAFGQLFQVIRARLQYRRFDGHMSDPITHISFERGDSVGVLLHDPERDVVVLVCQFRYPVYAGLGPDERAGDGARRAWLLEIVAGMQDAGRSAIEVGNSELLAEAGYAVKGDLQPIASPYVSPGGSSERIFLYLGEVDAGERVGEGGGVTAEGEDIEIVELPFDEAMDMTARGEIQDAKTIIALQHLALRKAREIRFT